MARVTVETMRGMRWRPAPGWPPAPLGWSPPAGWQPDPSWPPSPDGWIWWESVPRSRRQRLARGLLIGVPTIVVVGFFGMLVALQVGYERAGCGSVDPTDSENYSSVTILNDTAAPVVVSDCVGDECQIDHVPSRLGPGQRFNDQAACAASGADMTSWRITASNGTLIGYIAVDTPRKQDGLVFAVSRASRNRTTPTPAQ